LLTKISKILGDKSQEILRGVADEVLATLKNENLKDVDKKKEIDAALSETTT